ncbi:hypothetical protein OGAPHI_002257 [Ogataea philodendri]|uniref:Uncharacterized protein n=1 Tax=Ogataea philodendri TaxID=1378263 RepID=A0A9P8PAB2_9ASCO|nr:uncharacterized protein OGAPHI_002257 [Ogataea philodendri]KAH3668503.1 hypothetical protein OGAPHI_002257 [Ogataea philodendri]
MSIVCFRTSRNLSFWSRFWILKFSSSSAISHSGSHSATKSNRTFNVSRYELYISAILGFNTTMYGNFINSDSLLVTKTNMSLNVSLAFSININGLSLCEATKLNRSRSSKETVGRGLEASFLINRSRAVLN